jgi:hypothetical protein
MRHSPNSFHGEHPDKVSHIPIAGPAHPGMFLRMHLPSFLLPYIIVTG